MVEEEGSVMTNWRAVMGNSSSSDFSSDDEDEDDEEFLRRPTPGRATHSDTAAAGSLLLSEACESARLTATKLDGVARALQAC